MAAGFVKLADQVGDQGGEDILFAHEVAIQATRRQPRACRDVAHARVGEPVAGKHGAGGVKNAGPGAQAFRRARRERGLAHLDHAGKSVKRHQWHVLTPPPEPGAGYGGGVKRKSPSAAALD